MRGMVSCVAVIAVAVAFSHASARDYRVGDIIVSQPWARATAKLARAGAAYLTISVRGGEPDRLIAVTTPAARKAEIHGHSMDGGVRRRRRIGASEGRPGAPSVLRPGAMHVMLMGLRAQLRKGATFPLTLQFEKAGKITVEAVIHGIGARKPGP